MSKFLRFIFVVSLFFSLLFVTKEGVDALYVSESEANVESAVIPVDDDSDNSFYFLEGTLTSSSNGVVLPIGNHFFSRTNTDFTKYFFWVERSWTRNSLEKDKMYEKISNLISTSKRMAGHYIYGMRKILI
ncbi:MAG TPA: hypothetical protein PKW49_06055 [Paludibacteraceae bacterium]|jgi:hypothetical protein|nr:hypothetical protein [Paludibacteraceae bacterium]HQF50036.1 hypothetical protein [Paludibacteraceae bacterium]